MSDLIDRQAAIDALKNDMASLDHIIQGMSGYDVRLDAYVSQRNQVNCDIDTISNLPPAQPEPCEDAVSRQAAIDAIKDRYYKYGRFAKIEELVWSIEKLPPAQPEPCEDAVSRKDCLQALSHLMDVEGFRSGWAVSRANVECMLKAMPSVTPKQCTGKWIRNGWAITCSECGYDMPYTVRNFCPNCGAKMEGVAE